MWLDAKFLSIRGRLSCYQQSRPFELWIPGEALPTLTAAYELEPSSSITWLPHLHHVHQQGSVQKSESVAWGESEPLRTRASRLGRERVAWDEASRLGRERVAWDESESLGTGASRLGRERVAWDESESLGAIASRLGREQVAWGESKSLGARASRLGHVTWDARPSRPR